MMVQATRRMMLKSAACGALFCSGLPITTRYAHSQDGDASPQICTELSLSNLPLAHDYAAKENRANLQPNLTYETEAASLYYKLWHPNRRFLNVDFVEAPSYLDRAIAFAREWNSYMGMQLRFGSNLGDDRHIGSTVHILVSFTQGIGSWSYIGTDSLYFAERQRPSMNFGWLHAGSSDDEMRRVTLHEFGHALGLIHEHKHRDAQISWKKDKVYQYYKNRGWSKERVDSNIFDRYEDTQFNGTDYDQKSIMHYPIDKRHVDNSADAVGWNTALSPLDIGFIGELYPGPLNKLPDL